MIRQVASTTKHFGKGRKNLGIVSIESHHNFPMGLLTSINLLYPLIYLLQTECSLGAAIIFILVDVEDLLIRTGQGSSWTARSVRDDSDPTPRRQNSQSEQRML